MSQLVKTKKSIKISMKKLLQDKENEIARLETENNRLRNIISLMPGNVFWKDRQGRFLGCNNNVAQLLNLSPQDFVGKTALDLFDDKITSAMNASDEKVYTTGNELSIEEVGINIHKQPAIYLTKKIPLLFKDGKPIEILGVSFDITERIQMENDLKIAKENAEASNHAKSQFLAVINHELSTPLSCIIGLIDLLKQGSLPLDEQNTIVDSIQNCSQHLLSLVNEVLDFSRLEKEEYNLHLTSVHLPHVINEVHSFLSLLAKQKGLNLNIELDPTLQKTLITDPRILRQILINLVNNAIKFTETGSITIRTQVLQQQEQTTLLEIAVVDTGKGIPSDKLECIFEPFQQLENAYTRQSSRHGTGLGLTIVKKLAELLKTKISVKSQLGQGSTFSFISEFQTSDIVISETEVPFETEEKQIDIQKHSEKQPHILLLEDDPIIQYIHKKMLEQFECTVDVISHGLEAIPSANQYDIIFVDLSLPDISGFEVIKLIRKEYPDNNMPIVALTVYTGKEEKQACLDAGANDFASKPITQARLKEILMSYLKKSNNFELLY